MELPSPCAACGTHGAQKRCQCHTQRYCNETCQHLVWKTHRKRCPWQLSKKKIHIQRAHGNDSEKLLVVDIVLGEIFGQHGRLDEAEKSLLDAERISKMVLGDGPSAGVVLNLANLYQKQGKYEKAVEKYNEALTINRCFEHNEGLANSLHGLGTVFQARGQLHEAAEKYEEAKEIYLVCSSDKVRVVLGDLGSIHQQNGMFDKAMMAYTEALELERLVCSPVSPLLNSQNTSCLLLNIASVLVNQDRLEEAVTHTIEARRIICEIHGKKSAEAAVTLVRLGQIYIKQGKIEESLTQHHKALRYRRRALGDCHEGVANSLCHIAEILQGTGQLLEALGKTVAQP